MPAVVGEEPRAAVHGTEPFPCFDGLRAIAALSVVVCHFFANQWYVDPDWAPAGLQSFIARLGHFGVAVFFVISGFLLYRPYVLAHFAGRPVPRLGSFWLRRFARIFPAYWVVVLVCTVVFGLFTVRGISDAVTYYGLLQIYRADWHLLGVGVAWTLAIEVSFYVALPGIAWLLRRPARNAALHTKYRAQVAGLVAMALLAIAVRVWDLWIFEPGRPRSGDWLSLTSLGVWLINYLDWFAVGMLMAVGSAWLAVGGALPRVVTWLGQRTWLAWLFALEFYWLLTRIHYPWYEFAPVGARQEFLRAALTITAAAFLVGPAVFGDQLSGGIRRALRMRTLVFLGVVSYGIYLWHNVLWHASEDWIDDGYFPSNLFVRGLLVFALTIALAALSYWLIETPARRWAQRRSRRPSGGGGSVAATAPEQAQASATGAAGLLTLALVGASALVAVGFVLPDLV